MIYRLQADATGETSIARLEIPIGARDTANNIETTGVSLFGAPQRAPSHGYEPSGRRQLVVVLRGAMVVGTSDGASQRLGPGDAVLEEDFAGTRGHTFEDVGDERLAVLRVGIPDDADLPL